MTELPTGSRALQDEVRARYGRAAEDAAAGCCGPSPASGAGCSGTGDTVPDGSILTGPDDEVFGVSRYGAGETAGLPSAAVAASLGCGNPLLVADLRAGDRVLDLGSGGGIDVLLSARRVGPTGFVFGVDMTPQMLALARANAAEAGATNVEFREGTIEDIPLPDSSVDVVISNCVINLSVDKDTVLQEAYRVLVPGGRFGVSDVVAEDRLSAADRADRGNHVGCIAGALSRSEYLDGLADAGFVGAQVIFTHEVADGMHGAVIRAIKRATVD